MNEKPLVILEMANNHMGDVSHGLHIVNQFKKVTEGYKDLFDFAFKLQLRHPSFIHPDFADRMDIKHVKRFTETTLREEDFIALKEEIEGQGFISMCTPFDEPSVEKMIELKFEMFKVASSSFGDWPLLEALAKVEKPLVLSTACADTTVIDNVVSFLNNRDKDFAIMHCVSTYPTENKDLEMSQISYLKHRYDGIRVGYSTHEAPDNFKSIFMAVALGADVFEKHVGVPTEKYALNGYSCTPEQFAQWLSAAREAYEMYGSRDGRMGFTEPAKKYLNQIARGVFAKRVLKEGETMKAEDIFLAMPKTDGQLTAVDLSKYASFTVTHSIGKNAPVLFDNVAVTNTRENVSRINDWVMDALEQAKITVPNGIAAEISAHYGVDRFDEYGAVLINLINREYCKMLLLLKPGQKYPSHIHNQKEETLHILAGDLKISLEGVEHHLKEGDLLTIKRGQRHSFETKIGAIIEEISTTYFKGDSIYDDSAILNNPDRKITYRIYSR